MVAAKCAPVIVLLLQCLSFSFANRILTDTTPVHDSLHNVPIEKKWGTGSNPGISYGGGIGSGYGIGNGGHGFGSGGGYGHGSGYGIGYNPGYEPYPYGSGPVNNCPPTYCPPCQGPPVGYAPSSCPPECYISDMSHRPECFRCFQQPVGARIPSANWATIASVPNEPAPSDAKNIVTNEPILSDTIDKTN